LSALQWVAAVSFVLALVHTFSTDYFERLARRRPAHAGLWHLLGEVEIVFGFWAAVLVVGMVALEGVHAATRYLDTLDFTEPLFVFAIMVIAGSRPILVLARGGVAAIARFVPLRGAVGFYCVALTAVPLLGSLITEPAAMTLAAMMLRDRVYHARISSALRYATLGVLFVNVSIGGTLTPFAAPPVLMVAAKWQWDVWYMLAHFGWKAGFAVFVNAVTVALVFRRELARIDTPVEAAQSRLSGWIFAAHVLPLAGVVVFAHHPPIFLAMLLFYLGMATAYPQHQDRLILREGLLVAFFLAGLVVLGGQQRWWLEPLLRGMDESTVYFGATVLTAITDNAALTYLGSLVDGLGEGFKRALVAGAVTGGGLTVIANAPNPAGFAILRDHFDDGTIHPLGLFVAALPATAVAVLAFRLL
jgi:hypothetical protein